MHAQRTRLAQAAIAALALGLAAPGASAATDHPLIGTWEGTWPNGLVAEITVTAVDNKGAAYGIYCTMGPTHFRFSDLHPDDGVNARVDRKKRLKFKLGKMKYEFRPDRSDPDAMRMIHRRGGRKATVDVERINIKDAACRSRVAPLPIPASD